MWGTFVLDSYRWDQRRDMQAAIEEIASARDSYGFASGGVYCFWELGSRRVLYVGRAVDLPERFAQHHGMRGTREGTKYTKIVEHFSGAEQLGFTILVRAPNAQTNVARLRKQVEADFGPPPEDDWEYEDDTDDPREREIAHAEGIALHSYVLAHGGVPPWNAMGGELSVWGATMNRPDHSGELTTGAVDMLLQARRTITELADDPTATQFESVLQLARSQAVARAMLANEQLSDLQIIEALDAIREPFFAADRERIRAAGYLEGRCRLAAEPSPPVAELRSAWTQGAPLPAWLPSPPLRDSPTGAVPRLSRDG
jgi:hypothetical protein